MLTATMQEEVYSLTKAIEEKTTRAASLAEIAGNARPGIRRAEEVRPDGTAVEMAAFLDTLKTEDEQMNTCYIYYRLY